MRGRDDATTVQVRLGVEASDSAARVPATGSNVPETAALACC
jgi:hypothetical protein